jgi:Xaa-Pro aminopeptidase
LLEDHLRPLTRISHEFFLLQPPFTRDLKMTHENILTPSTEIESRISRLQLKLQEKNIDGALILQNTDLFYFSGTTQQANLFVPAEGAAILLARKNFERARRESALRRVIPMDNPGDIPGLLRQAGYCLPDKLGLECDVLPANLYLKYRQIFDDSKIVDISQAIRLIRAEKSPYEVQIIRAAAQLSDCIAGYMQEVLRPGITEIELAGIIEARARKLGHQGLVRMRLWGNEMFYGHLMSGPSAAAPSYLASPTGGTGMNPSFAQGPGSRPVGRYEPILLDYVFAHRGYLADHTRIFALGGLPDELMAAHEAMLDIQKVLKKMARPKIKAGEIYRRALERAIELGYESNFMGADDQRVPFVGHGVGLELDEFPFLAKGQQLELKKGMIVALEPKAVFPGKGVVGIENTHVVTDRGLDALTLFEDGIIIV